MLAVTSPGGGGGGTTGAFWSQGQVSNLDGANAWPGWYDGGGVVVPPFGGDTSGGSGQLYNGSGAGVLTGGGDGGQQYTSSGPGGVEDSYANFGISGGSPPFSGGNDGVTVSDRDGLGTSRPAMAGQQLDGDEGHDEGGLLGTFGDFPHEPLEDDGFPTVGPALHVLAHPSNRHRHALLSLSKHHVAGADWWVGDSGASVHGTGNKEHMYNIRVPVAEESRLVVGNGETMKVQFIGDLDLVMHCNPDVVVTLRDVSYVPGLWYDLMSFSIIQEMHEIRLNKTGAHILDGRVHFRKNRNGNYVQATRILRGSRGPPAMMAALMRPGRVRSMSINNPHYALGHANEATARATAKQLEIQVTGSLGHCAGCANGKAIRAAVPKTTSLRATRPLGRTFGDLTGPFPVGSGAEERSQRQLPQQQQPIASFGAGVGSGAEEQSQRQLPQQQQPIASFGARVGSGAEEQSQRQLPQQQQPIASFGAGVGSGAEEQSQRQLPQQQQPIASFGARVGSGAEEQSQRQLPQQQQPIASFGARVGSGAEEQSQRQLPQQQQPIASFGARVGSGAEEQSQRQLPQQQQPIASFGARVGSRAEEQSQRQLPQQQQPIASFGARVGPGAKERTQRHVSLRRRAGVCLVGVG